MAAVDREDERGDGTSSMTARLFVDTNVWVYAVDDDEPAKQAQARRVLHPEGGVDPVISAQVMGEFYVTVTRKLARPFSPEEAGLLLKQMGELPVVPLDARLVAAAVAGSIDWRVSYWDALIIAAAEAGGCSRILTEDLADGATYGSVRVENPFAERTSEMG
jgi:predicted nucleic acid-binding protein